MKEPGAGIPKNQETIVWWGGYSPWTMTPSLLICLVLTGGITWWALEYVDRDWIRLAVFGLSSLVWVVQTARFAYRFLGVNYFVTTRRLVQDWGIIYKRMRTVFLEEVEKIEVERSSLEEFLGVGRIIIRPRTPATKPPMVWRGVRHVRQVAERLEALVKK